jgi:hypothetical protein
MKKLIIKGSRHFNMSDNNSIHAPATWSGYEYGLYEVTMDAPQGSDRMLVYYGLDNNVPTMKNPIIMIMPFPDISIENEVQREIEQPQQLVQFDGTAITGDVLLKAIAIAQNPELAKDLL